MLQTLIDFNNWLNGIVWGPPFMILLVGTGLYLTFRLGFFQFTHLRFAWQRTFATLFRRKSDQDKGAITPFQAVSSAMAATIGVGNIAGVATAIALGGPGAVFWMWMVALVGMATKLAEATLGLKYRRVDDDGRVSGGVFYYIENGLGKRWKWLAMVYAILAGLAAFGIGNMVQANTMAHAMETGLGIPNWVTGIGVMLLVGAVTLGGIKRIAVTAERIVPTMALIYVIGAVGILISYYDQIPGAFAQIISGAFTPASAIGGFAGATVAGAIRYGIARGIFSNEAGLGSASIVHAQARNKPFAQGLWGMWEVFIDTLVICTMTALVILVTGVIQTGQTGAELTTSAFSLGLPGLGGWVVLCAIVLFSYTTMLTWNFYGEKSWEYAFGKRVILPYRIIFIGVLYLGAIGGLTTVWDISDTLNGLMAAPNLIALLLLAGVLAKEKVQYLKEQKEEMRKEKENGQDEKEGPG
ncbi:alanine/glycine:cation symporter family protein [Ectothiorhodospira shaposhnikovii]|uniref:alanine/glycine:cation symporter family protein n=1 Tax=Ectothiorhodospira shaposhnikovii TaxID=1054 RepID=UPI001EE9398E|nr:sodium:alanine symporter family protein [Ectothiorhodospira shaposhnikovii]MCG5511814.1 sodium:alanine symporter family protein [Ectothiorhodospira shaposhnikovii]